jgi:hypothetical protein
MDAAQNKLEDLDHTGADQSPSLFELAAVVALGASAWLYGVHVILLSEADTLAGHLSHMIRDGMMAFPVAAIAVGFGRWLAGRWGIREGSARDRVGLAAIMALIFAICLVPGVGVHQYLDRILDADAPGHQFHGHGIPVSATGAVDLLDLAVHGVRDALIGLAAAFPVTLLGLTLGARRRDRREAGRPATQGWALAGRLTACASIALVMLGVGVTGLTFRFGDPADDDHAPANHPVRVTAVPAGAAAEVDGLRVIPRSAKWVRHAPGAPSARTASPSEPDRLYLEFTVENPGTQARTFGRKEVRLEAPSGSAWVPLADDFPAIHIGPQDALTTMLIFEVPKPEPGLQLAWARGDREARIPIADGLDERSDGKAARVSR